MQKSASKRFAKFKRLKFEFFELSNVIKFVLFKIIFSERHFTKLSLVNFFPKK